MRQLLNEQEKQDQRSTAPPLVSDSQLVNQSTNQSVNLPIGYWVSQSFNQSA